MNSGERSIEGYRNSSCTFSSAEAYFTHHYLPKNFNSVKKERNKVIHISFDKINDIKDHDSSLSKVVRICNTIKRLKKEARDERMLKQQFNQSRRSSMVSAKHLQKKEVQNAKNEQQETVANLYRWWMSFNTTPECIPDDIRFEEIQKQQYHYPRWCDNESSLNVEDVQGLLNFGKLQETSCVSETKSADSLATNFFMENDFSINIVEELNALIADTNY